jgi:uracil phosphoribosyltransferase
MNGVNNLLIEVYRFLRSEEGLSYANPQKVSITTPTGSSYDGESIDTEAVVAISIIRAGDSLLDAFIKIAPAAQVGKILIQRDEETRMPVLFYSKLPPLASKKIMLLDPMLATGGSAKAAIQVVLDNGAKEEDIIMLCVVSCPEGIANVLETYPKMRIVSGEIDAGLNEKVRMGLYSPLGLFCSSIQHRTFDLFRLILFLVLATMATDTMVLSERLEDC